MKTSVEKKIGLGGGCHWCTEAVFASLCGVTKVEQGWIAAKPPHDSFSEAVIVTYDPDIISLKDLIEIHLSTHSSTSNHSMRSKYRSAVYWFDEADGAVSQTIIKDLQPQFSSPIITLILPFVDFKPSLPEHQNYYYENPEKPFCTVYIEPKLLWLRKRFTSLSNLSEKNRPFIE